MAFGFGRRRVVNQMKLGKISVQPDMTQKIRVIHPKSQLAGFGVPPHERGAYFRGIKDSRKLAGILTSKEAVLLNHGVANVVDVYRLRKKLQDAGAANPKEALQFIRKNWKPYANLMRKESQ